MPMKKLNLVNLRILFTVKEEMVYEACGNQDYEEVVKRSEESVQELQVCMCGCKYDEVCFGSSCILLPSLYFDEILSVVL
jgi:hypothetical protein